MADPEEGRRIAGEVADTARAVGAHHALVVALCALGWAAREIYAYDDALASLGEAVRVARRHELHDPLTEALTTRASVHMEFGDMARARKDIDAARAASTAHTRAEVEVADALVHQLNGNAAAAGTAYRRALRHVRDDQTHLKFKALHNLGLAHMRTGRHVDAARYLSKAATHAQTMGAPVLVATAVNSQALAASELGDPVTALRRFAEAEQMMRASGVPLGEMLTDKASALLNLRLLDEAAASIQGAVAEFATDVGRALMLAEALLLQARIELERECHDDAIAAAQHAEHLLRRQRRTGWRAHAALLRLRSEVARDLDGAAVTVERQLDRVERTMTAMGHLPGAVEAGLLSGQLALENERFRRAARKLRHVSEIAMRGPLLLRLQGRTAAALLADAQQDRRRLGRICQQGLADLARYRATFASAELRARAASHGWMLAELGLRTAMRSGRVESVWCWLERGRAVSFVRAEHDPEGTIQSQLAQLRQLERDLATTTDQDPVRMSEVLRSITQAERGIRQATWVNEGSDAHWTLPTVRSLRAVRAALADRVLLQYGLIDGQVIGVAVTAGRMRFARLAAFDDIAGSGQQLAFALRRLAQPRSSASVAAARASALSELARLGRDLVAPLIGDIGCTGEVVVAPPAQLIGIPWGALPELTGTHVRVSPSATAWHLSSTRTPRSGRIIAVAGPGLAGAAEEVACVAARHGGDVLQLVGPAATCVAVQREVAGAALVHVACHGRLRTDSPTFSSLRLEDGPLTVHDLEGLERPAHHWVLAACDLGAPGRLAGSELEGVLAALLLGGAAGVVAAVVSVPDIATLGYMADLHEALATGVSLADAVHRARTKRDLSDPVEFVTSVAFSCYGGG